MLSIDQLAAIVWKRKVTFLVTFVLVVAAAAAVTYALPKVYRTGAYLYVSSGRQAASDFEQVQTNQVITRTIAELLQTRNTADDVAEALPFEASGRNLQTTVDIQPIAQSQLITITAEASSAQRAQTIANTYARTFIDTFSGTIGADRAAARVTLATPAPIISSQARPRPKLYMLIGIILAAFAALAASLLRHRTDQRLELDASDTEIHDLPIIGRVSTVPTNEIGQGRLLRPSESKPLRGLAEEYRLLLANLAFANHGKRPRTLAVVSAGQGEGKSTTVLSLGRAAAEVGVHTVLVDADLRRPGLTALTGSKVGGPSRGLSSFLVDLEPLALSDVATEVAGIDLSVVPSGPLPPNPAALLGSRALSDFMERAAKVFDLVVFDTPPLSVGADASLVCSAVEGVVLVIDARNTRRTSLLQAVDQLKRAKANVLGVVVNKSGEPLDSAYYYGVPGEPTPRRRKRGGKLEPLGSGARDSDAG